ncbi:MAG: DoxX protein [Maricaulaceae bacterium]
MALLPAKDRDIALSLFIMRALITVFFLIWVADKLFSPATSTRVFEAFYFSSPPVWLITAFGLAQLLVVLAFAAGVMRTVSYGAILLMHATSTLSTYERLLDPLARPNILFWAAVPVLGAVIALFLMRKRDVILNWEGRAAR